MITKTFLFKVANGGSIIINTLILMFVFNWNNIVYPFLIALAVYFSPRVIVRLMDQAGYKDEREEFIDKKASLDTISFITLVASGAILIASVYYYINNDDISKLIVIVSAIVVQSLIWTKSFILEYDYKVNAGDIIKFDLKELMFGLFSALMVYIFVYAVTSLADGTFSIIAFVGAFLVALIGNRVYMIKFGIRDERLEGMITNSATSSVRFNFSLLFGTTSILTAIYLFSRDGQLLSWIAIFALYFVFLSSIKTVQSGYNREMIS